MTTFFVIPVQPRQKKNNTVLHFKVYYFWVGKQNLVKINKIVKRFSQPRFIQFLITLILVFLICPIHGT